jgi:hypothetical protein
MSSPAKTIVHPVLGIIMDIWEGRVWQTAPRPLGAFGYVASIAIDTAGGEPSEAQMNAAARLANATPEFKAEVEGYLFGEYRENVRPAYIKTVGDPRYRARLTLGDLPEVEAPSGIWKVITGVNSVGIDEKGDIHLEFIPAFDPGHDFAVRFRGGKLYEVLIDG